MTRISVSQCLLAAAFIALSPSADAAPRGVVLLLTDDQGAHLGCMGTRGLATPNADRLAAEGVLFRNAFAACSSCSPARSALLTGMYPHANGHWRNTHTANVPGDDADYGRDSRFREIESVGVHEDIPTLIEILNEAGYVTGITQKFHLSPPWKYPFRHRLGVAMVPAQHGQAAARFLAACGDAPFFLLANIGNTHRPFAPHIAGIDVPPVDPEAIGVPPELADTAAMRADLVQYFTSVQCADACAGAVLDAIASAGRSEDTLVIFTSDQGYAYHRAKATAYLAGTAVPFIVRGPGVVSAAEHSALISHVDLVPTILDFAGLPIPGTVQGRSLRPFLEESPAADWRQVVFMEHNAHGPNPKEYYPIRAAFDGRFQYLRNLRHERRADVTVEAMHLDKKGQDIFWAGPADMFPGGLWQNASFQATLDAKDTFPVQYELLKRTFVRPPEELYDIHTNPGELYNLTKDTRFAADLARLRVAVDAWMAATDDPGLAVCDTLRRTNTRKSLIP